MFHVILLQPEILPNTGSIIRLYVNAGCSLYLIEPFGLELDDKRLRRAGLDYHEYVSVRRYLDLQSCLEAFGQPRPLALTTKGSRAFREVAYQRGDAFLFGPESRGLPKDVRSALSTDRCPRLSIREGCRSLNLSNMVAMTVYEARHQSGFVMDWAGRQAWKSPYKAGFPASAGLTGPTALGFRRRPVCG